MKDEKLQFHYRLLIYRSSRNFGPGVADLMRLVKERGSLSAACKEMHMAYSKAWKIMNKAEEDLGFRLMEGKRGGESGGQTILTAQGEEFLKNYLAFETESRIEIEKIFSKYFNELS